MNFVVTREGWHIDLCSEPETRDQLISVVVQHNGTDLMKSLFVLTPLMGSVVVKRSVGSLNAVAGSKVNADYHGHLKPCSQEVSEVILDGLPEVLEYDDALLLAPLGKSHPILAFHQGAQVKVALPDD